MDTEYLNRFEERLQQELLRLCTDYHVLDGIASSYGRMVSFATILTQNGQTLHLRKE